MARTYVEHLKFAEAVLIAMIQKEPREELRYKDLLSILRTSHLTTKEMMAGTLPEAARTLAAHAHLHPTKGDGSEAARMFYSEARAVLGPALTDGIVCFIYEDNYWKDKYP